jgi:hypothetical protein
MRSRIAFHRRCWAVTGRTMGSPRFGCRLYGHGALALALRRLGRLRRDDPGTVALRGLPSAAAPGPACSPRARAAPRLLQAR